MVFCGGFGRIQKGWCALRPLAGRLVGYASRGASAFDTNTARQSTIPSSSHDILRPGCSSFLSLSLSIHVPWQFLHCRHTLLSIPGTTREACDRNGANPALNKVQRQQVLSFPWPATLHELLCFSEAPREPVWRSLALAPVLSSADNAISMIIRRNGLFFPARLIWEICEGIPSSSISATQPDLRNS